MTKLILILFLVTIAVIACNKKAVPVITSRVSDPPSPAKRIVDVKADIELGKTIFTTRCSRCYDLPKPEQYTALRWEGILSYMIPRARLNEEQGVHAKAYLKENAKK